VLNTVFLFALSASLVDTLPPPSASPIALQGAIPSAALAAPAAVVAPAKSARRALRKSSVDSMVVDKSDRTLTLFQRGQPVAEYRVALGNNPVGPKVRRGDGRTPEGLYFIEGRNPQSKYHLSLRISYPSRNDRATAARRGVATGGDIMIHGLPKKFATIGALHRQQDWTEGCVAVTNEEIEEIWNAVPNGARILIQP
jgi:murein L,D-transpeptidase YafK